MSETGSSFRTAVVGGFNRQDVLNYIEQSSRAAAERSAALQKEAEAARRDLAAARAEGDKAREREAALALEAERLNKALAEKTAALAEAQAALSRERVELDSLREELGALKEKTAEMVQGATAYAELKDRTATIELEAHQRARAIEKAAEERAKKLRVAAEQILYKVQAGYGRLRSDVDATIAHASGELGRADKALENVRQEFAEHDVELEKLLRSYREASAVKVPDPLPLEEK